MLLNAAYSLLFFYHHHLHHRSSATLPTLGYLKRNSMQRHLTIESASVKVNFGPSVLGPSILGKVVGGSHSGLSPTLLQQQARHDDDQPKVGCRVNGLKKNDMNQDQR
jgi:hypothetical protein